MDAAEVIYAMHQADIYGFSSIKELDQGRKELLRKIDDMQSHLAIDAPEWDNIHELEAKAEAWGSS